MGSCIHTEARDGRTNLLGHDFMRIAPAVSVQVILYTIQHEPGVEPALHSRAQKLHHPTPLAASLTMADVSCSKWNTGNTIVITMVHLHQRLQQSDPGGLPGPAANLLPHSHQNGTPQVTSQEPNLQSWAAVCCVFSKQHCTGLLNLLTWDQAACKMHHCACNHPSPDGKHPSQPAL